MIPTPKGRASSEDQNVQVGWRMAGLASETVSYVIAGGLLGWLADHELETDHWLATGALLYQKLSTAEAILRCNSVKNFIIDHR